MTICLDVANRLANCGDVQTNTADRITQESATQIARLALDGDSRFSHEAIGADDGDINDMEALAGGTLTIRARNDSEVAVYARADGSLVIVAGANGPVAITAIRMELDQNQP